MRDLKAMKDDYVIQYEQTLANIEEFKNALALSLMNYLSVIMKTKEN